MKYEGTPIWKVLLDMDGVIVDNLVDLAMREGMQPKEIVEKKSWMKKENPDFDYVVSLIRKHLYSGWHFENAPAMKSLPTFKKLIRHWLKNGVRVEILSSGCSGEDIYPEICRQKELWLEKHGIGLLPTNYARGSSEKYKWAGEGILLIDDYAKNIEQFRNAGGHGIIYQNVNTLMDELQYFSLL